MPFYLLLRHARAVAVLTHRTASPLPW